MGKLKTNTKIEWVSVKRKGVNKKRIGRYKKYSDQSLISTTKRYIDLIQNASIEIPKVVDIPLMIGISSSQFYLRMEKLPELRELVNKVIDYQHKALLENGIKGKWNTVITKLMLSKHGYHEKIDTDITSKGDKVGLSGILSEISGKTLAIDAEFRDSSTSISTNT